MKILLAMLGTAGIAGGAVVPITSTFTNSTNIQNSTEAVEPIVGLVKTDLKIAQSISDVNMGGSKHSQSDVSRNIYWSEIGIDAATYDKIDFTHSWISLEIYHGYSDNSGGGNSESWTKEEKYGINKIWTSGKISYDEGRHHKGSGRQTDHDWQYSLSVNSEAIVIWDYVWVWANGNWGNKAVSNADISIQSVSYHFELQG